MLGVAAQQLVLRGVLRLPIELVDLRRLIQKIALFFFLPAAMTGAIWNLKDPSPLLAMMPFLGAFALIFGGVLAIGASRILKHTPVQKGAMFCSGSFSNLASLGSLVCFIFLGEPGFAMVPAYNLLEHITYYTVGFPYARMNSPQALEEQSWPARLGSAMKDPLVLVVLGSVIVGALLNYSGVARPHWYTSLNRLVVPTLAILLLISIGMGLKFSRVLSYWREGAALAVIKFMIVPLAVGGLAYLVGLGDVQDGLPLKVAVLLAAMPTAFVAVVPASLYDLDLDLANSCWVLSTGTFLLFLPLVYLVV